MAKKKSVNKMTVTEQNPLGAGREKGGMNKKTRQAVELVVNHDVEPRKALMIVHGKPKVSPDSVSRLRGHVARWSIERPSVQKIAHTAMARFAAGEAVNGIEPKAVDVRACAERIIDQVTPIVKRTENLNISVDCDPVDLMAFRRREIVEQVD